MRVSRFHSTIKRSNRDRFDDISSKCRTERILRVRSTSTKRKILDEMTNSFCFMLKLVFEMKNRSTDSSSLFNIHFIQLEPGRTFRANESEKLVRIDPESSFQTCLNVHQRRTIEICVSRWWSSLSMTESDYSIKFLSLIVSPSIVQLSSSQSYQRFVVENRLQHRNQELSGPPTIQWKHLVQTLRPNKDESKIQILSNRDCLPRQRQIHQLLLVYNLSLVIDYFLRINSKLLVILTFS